MLCLLIFSFGYCQLATSISYFEEENPYLYLDVDEIPTFKYKQMNVSEYLYHQIKWPSEFDGNFSILVSFVVKSDGTIDKIKIEKSKCTECDIEIIRVLKLMPKWRPGKLNKKNVDILLYMPISFRIIY